MNKGIITVLVIILVVAVGGASFYGGTIYGKSQAQANLRAAFQSGGAGFPGAAAAAAGAQGGTLGRQRNGQGGNFIAGTIKQIGDGSLVVSDNSGKDTQVKVTDTTLIQKNTSVQLADLKEGETVVVSGSAGTDGTVTARSVRVGSQDGFGFPGGAAGAPGAAGALGGTVPQATPAQ